MLSSRGESTDDHRVAGFLSLHLRHDIATLPLRCSQFFDSHHLFPERCAGGDITYAARTVERPGTITIEKSNFISYPPRPHNPQQGGDEIKLALSCKFLKLLTTFICSQFGSNTAPIETVMKNVQVFAWPRHSRDHRCAPRMERRFTASNVHWRPKLVGGGCRIGPNAALCLRGGNGWSWLRNGNHGFRVLSPQSSGQHLFGGHPLAPPR